MGMKRVRSLISGWYAQLWINAHSFPESMESAMKKIVFCADGTWDRKSNNINGFKLFNALLISSEQMPFYDNGIRADGNPRLAVLPTNRDTQRYLALGNAAAAEANGAAQADAV
jgi:hypothetical protein